MDKKLLNWRLWAGFSISLLALLVYILLLQQTRSIFWGSLVLFVVSALFIISGLKRAFGQPQAYRGKVSGPVLALLSVILLGIFGWGTYLASKLFARGLHAPQVGQKAPDFNMVDDHGNRATLTQLLSASMPKASASVPHPKGVLLVFYRGYW